MEIYEWPATLRSLLNEMEKTEHQPYSETMMDSGRVIRRKLTSIPVPLFKIDARVSREQKDQLQQMVDAQRLPRDRRPYSFPHPSGDGIAYGLLVDMTVGSVGHVWSGSGGRTKTTYHVVVLFEDKTREVSDLLKYQEETP